MEKYKLARIFINNNNENKFKIYKKYTWNFGNHDVLISMLFRVLENSPKFYPILHEDE